MKLDVLDSYDFENECIEYLALPKDLRIELIKSTYVMHLVWLRKTVIAASIEELKSVILTWEDEKIYLKYKLNEAIQNERYEEAQYIKDYTSFIATLSGHKLRKNYYNE